MKKIIFIVFCISAFFMDASCTRAMSTPPANTPAAKASTSVPIEEEKTSVETATEAAQEVVAMDSSVELLAQNVEACLYKDTGSPQPEKVGIEIKGMDGSKLYAVDLSKLPGCAVIFEGRFPWQTKYLPISTALSQAQITNTDESPWNPWDVHMIVDVKSLLGAFNPRPMNELVKDIIPEEYLDWFVYSEGSVWFYDPTWNMSDVTTVKPSIGQELEAKKLRDAMLPGQYLFPRIIMQPTGTMFVYYQKDAGDTAYNNGTAAGCTKTNQPEVVPVYGLWDGQGYSAAIGAGHCYMAIWIDEDKTPTIWDGYQKDGDEIVNYKSKVEAWIFPTSWKTEQVNAWIAQH